MYDLRYPRPSQPMEAVVERTMPLLRFEQHYNEYRVNLGFDVDLDTGVLAVGTFIVLGFLRHALFRFTSRTRNEEATGQVR